jgi:hypothetical protein
MYDSAKIYEVKAEKFKAEIIDYIYSDPKTSIARANQERQIWI